MNKLFRGIERSRCVLQASRQAFSTSESASAFGCQNLFASLQATGTNNRPCYDVAPPTPIASRSGGATWLLANEILMLNRHFSSLNTNIDTAPSPISDNGQEEDYYATTQRPPSALDQANLNEITPGHALFVLQRYASKGAPFTGRIRQTDFVKLCESARRGKMRDGKVIATACTEFKKNNRFVIQVMGADAAIDGMLRAMNPMWKVQDGKPKLRAAVFVGEQIIDDKTGLYFAVTTSMVNKVMKELHESLLDMEKNGIKLRVETAVGEEETEKEPNADEKLLSDALRVTEGMLKLLIKRRTRPERDMKKRARRVYLKMLQVGSGPNAATLELATKISIVIGGSSVVRDNIVAPYEAAWWSKPVNGVVLKSIEEASAKEFEQQEAAEAAAVSEMTEGEGGEGDETQEDVVEDDSNADGGGDSSDEAEGNSKDEAKSVDEKRD